MSTQGKAVVKHYYKSLFTNTEHTSFSDEIVLCEILPNLRTLEDSNFGDPDPTYGRFKAFTRILRSFFDRFLKGKTHIDLVALSDDFVRIKTVEEEVLES